MASPVLARSERVCLRHPIEADRAAWRLLRDQSKDFHEPWEPRPPAGVSYSGDAGFDRLLATAWTDQSQRHMICRNTDGAMLGMVNLTQITGEPFLNAVMGYWIGRPFARQGYASEGVVLCLGRAFGELGLHRVEANVVPTNEASLALVRRVGFRDEGFSLRYLQIAGVWADHTRWAMTIEDWQAHGHAIPPEHRHASRSTD